MKYNGKEYYSQGDVYNAIEQENEKLKAENRKLENKIHKLGIRIYQNVDGEKREEYKEYCMRHRL